MVSHLPSLTRTGQQYKQREQRRGAFWEDRYHAEAVEGYLWVALGLQFNCLLHY